MTIDGEKNEKRKKRKMMVACDVYFDDDRMMATTKIHIDVGVTIFSITFDRLSSYVFGTFSNGSHWRIFCGVMYDGVYPP
jgi:hypothetical protein